MSRQLLLPAALVAAVTLGATAAQAFKFEYLPADKCTLQKVEMEDPQLCLRRAKQRFNDSCVASGGQTQQDGKACKLPDNRVKAFRSLIDKQTGLPGPYNPAPKQAP